MSKHRWIEVYLETGNERSKFLILSYHVSNTTRSDPGDIVKKGLVCDICGVFLILWNHSNSIEKQK